MEVFSDFKPAHIAVKNLRLRTYIGFNEWERKKMQDIVISYSFSYDSAASAKKDDIDYGINYKTITKKIIGLIDQEKFDLIETIAELVLNTIQDFSLEIYNIEVQVEKPHALRFTDNVMVIAKSSERYKKAMIALGSNIQPEQNFAKAIDLLCASVSIVKKTDFIRTKAQKDTSQADFLNGALLVYTRLSLPELQRELKKIESRCGRIRSENKNAAREIDMDVISYNDTIIDQEDLDTFDFLRDFWKELQ